jgi:hypothetical protein
MSTEDIGKGSQWGPEITEHLGSARFGVVCLTPENVASQWLHFEAGALAVSVEGALAEKRMTPLLLGVGVTEIGTPLNLFQTTEPTRVDIGRLVRDMNALCDAPLPAHVLDPTFDAWWPDLDAKLRTIEQTAPESGVAMVETPPPADVAAEILSSVRSQERALLRLEKSVGNTVANAAARLYPESPQLRSSLDTYWRSGERDLRKQVEYIDAVFGVLSKTGISAVQVKENEGDQLEATVEHFPDPDVVARARLLARGNGVLFLLRDASGQIVPIG